MNNSSKSSFTDQARKDIQQLQEIFGITSSEAENSYQYYKNNLTDAVAGLVTVRENNSVSLDQAIAKSPLESEGSHSVVATCANNPAAPPADSDTPTGSTNNNPIDLTQDSQDDDLQKALALSLQDMQHQGGVISLEEQELSKALEASIAETQTDSYGTVSRFIDPLNPHERKRLEGFPVGLKNIGNTCWFSAVIQSLFNIPVFRDSIIHFQISDQTNTELPPHCVLFVLELQKLFALLLQSSQRYIDPKPAIDLLNALFQTLGGNHQQQDVSEFTHKLLEWIEDAFNYQDKTKSNPIVQLFTGQCVTEGKINETAFVNRSQFGAFPVQIEGHAHLHDSLEAATVNMEMEQETWFTHLPPVLVLELSRFKYNQLTGQAEKIHDALAFDKMIHLDRYLHCNASQTRELRKEMSLLRQKMKRIENALKSYTDYHGKKVPINDLLSLVFDFTSSRLEGVGGVTDAQAEGEGPSPRTGSKEEVEFIRKWLNQWRSEMDTEMSELSSSLSATKGSLEAVYADPSMKKTPYHLHAVLVHQGQASRGHYWAYVRKKKIKKKKKIMKETGTQTTYLDHMQQGEEEEEEEGKREGEGGDRPSRTGGKENGKVKSDDGEEDMEVCTIGSDAEIGSPLLSCDQSSGATPVTPIGDEKRVGRANTEEEEEEVWLKYNDVSVTSVNWEEVKLESFGGNNHNNETKTNTSAYCLLYISSENDKTWNEDVSDHQLSLALQRYIAYHNLLFDKELKAYDVKVQLQQLKTSSEGKELIKPAKAVRFEESVSGANGGHDMMAIASGAKRARPGSPSLEDMQIDMDSLPPVDPLLEASLKTRVSQKLQSFLQDLPHTITEPRLMTVFHYSHICQSSEKVRNAILYELVVQELKKENDINLSLLARREFIAAYRDPQVYQEFQTVKTLYNQFCSVCYHFVQSVNEAKESNWCLSLAHVISSFSLNSSICTEAGGKYALDQKPLAQLRCKALLAVSELGTAAFTSGEVSSSIVIGNEYIIPGLKAFSQHPFNGDEPILERVREEWCQCLDGSLTEDDSDKLADLLMKIVDGYTKAPNIKIPQIPPNLDTERLAAQYTTAFKALTSQVLS